MSYLNDDEHRILLAALRREKEFCSRQLTDSKRCVAVVQSLERKFQYDRFEQEIREKAIEEFAKRLIDKTQTKLIKEDIHSTTRSIGMDLCGWIDEIAEQMKEVEE